VTFVNLNCPVKSMNLSIS